MWITLNKGALSITKENEKYLIRAKEKEYITNYFPNNSIIDFNDNMFSILISEQEFSNFSKKLPSDIDQSRFENSIYDRTWYYGYDFLGENF